MAWDSLLDPAPVMIPTKEQLAWLQRRTNQRPHFASNTYYYYTSCNSWDNSMMEIVYYQGCGGEEYEWIIDSNGWPWEDA